MKKSSIILAFLLFSLFAVAQEINSKDVPTVVTAAFNAKYPGAKKVEWNKEGDNFEAEFKFANTEQSVVLDSKGNLLETEIEISPEDLPREVKKYVATNYPKEKIEEAAKITQANGTVTYEAEVNYSDLIFDSKGQFIKVLNE